MLKLCILVGLATGCGRLGFSERAAPDGRPVPADEAGDDAAIDPDAAIDAPSGLVVRFSMDDDPQLGSIRAAPSGYSVSCGAACPTAITGRVGGGYAFSGAGWIPLGHPELVTSAPFTVALWVRVTVFPANYMVPLAKPRDLTSNFDVFAFGVLQDGTAWYESSRSDTIGTVSTGTAIVGPWHHMAARWDGTNRALFLDGVFVAQAANGFDDSLLGLGLGGDLDNGSPVLPFIGDLDELQFFDRALGDTEIAALANP